MVAKRGFALPVVRPSSGLLWLLSETRCSSSFLSSVKDVETTGQRAVTHACACGLRSWWWCLGSALADLFSFLTTWATVPGRLWYGEGFRCFLGILSLLYLLTDPCRPVWLPGAASQSETSDRDELVDSPLKSRVFVDEPVSDSSVPVRAPSPVDILKMSASPFETTDDPDVFSFPPKLKPTVHIRAHMLVFLAL